MHHGITINREKNKITYMHFEFEEFYKFLLYAWVCFICVVLELHEFRFVEYHA